MDKRKEEMLQRLKMDREKNEFLRENEIEIREGGKWVSPPFYYQDGYYKFIQQDKDLYKYKIGLRGMPDFVVFKRTEYFGALKRVSVAVEKDGVTGEFLRVRVKPSLESLEELELKMRLDDEVMEENMRKALRANSEMKKSFGKKKKMTKPSNKKKSNKKTSKKTSKSKKTKK
jgi:hypothetical protein